MKYVEIEDGIYINKDLHVLTDMKQIVMIMILDTAETS